MRAEDYGKEVTFPIDSIIPRWMPPVGSMGIPRQFISIPPGGKLPPAPSYYCGNIRGEVKSQWVEATDPESDGKCRTYFPHVFDYTPSLTK